MGSDTRAHGMVRVAHIKKPPLPRATYFTFAEKIEFSHMCTFEYLLDRNYFYFIRNTQRRRKFQNDDDEVTRHDKLNLTG